MAGQGGSCARGHTGPVVGDQVLSGQEVAALGGMRDPAADAARTTATTVLAAAGVDAEVAAPTSAPQVSFGALPLTPAAMLPRAHTGATNLGTAVGAAADGRHHYRVALSRHGDGAVLRVLHTAPGAAAIGGETLAELPLPAAGGSDADLHTALAQAVQTVETHHRSLPGATSIPRGSDQAARDSAPRPAPQRPAPLLGGVDYDFGHLTGSEYRRGADQGERVWQQPPMHVGERIRVRDQPDAPSTARRTGDAAAARNGILTVGRTTVPALAVLRDAEVVEHDGGAVALYDQERRLLAVYDPRTRTAGQPDPPDGSALTAPQMAAVIAYQLRQRPDDPLHRALRQDVASAHQGGTPLAGADSAYLVLQQDMERHGQHLHFGARVDPDDYPAPRRAAAAEEPEPATPRAAAAEEPEPAAPAGSPVYALETGQMGVHSPRFNRTFRNRMNRINGRWNPSTRQWVFDPHHADTVARWHAEAFGPTPAQTAQQTQPEARQTIQAESEHAAHQRAARQQAAQAEAAAAPADMNYATSMPAFQAAYDAARARQAQGEAVVPFQTHDATGGLGARGFGVELEFVGGDRQAIARDLHAAGLTRTPYQQGYHRSTGDNQAGYWRFEHDCTVDGEIISPVLTDTPEHWQQLQQVVAIVKRHGGQVNERCGGHIHVGCGDYDHTVGNHSRLVNSFAAQQDILYRLAQDPNADAHRELRGSTWSSPVDKKPEGFRSLQDVRATLNSHGIALNFQSVTGSRGDHVEFRLWDGSLDAGTIQAQIKLSLALTDHATRATNDAVAAIPDSQRGAHYAHNVSGQRLTGAAWEQQTAEFRQFVDRTFTRPEDKAQITALFAATNWQPARPPTPQQAHVREMLKQNPDLDVSDLRGQVAVAPLRDADGAREVADFLTRHGPASSAAHESSALRSDTIAGNRARFSTLRNGLGEVVGAAHLTRQAGPTGYEAQVQGLALHPDTPPAQAIPALTRDLAERAQSLRGQVLSLQLAATPSAQYAAALHQAGWRPIVSSASEEPHAAQTLWQRPAGEPAPPPPLPPVPAAAPTADRPAAPATVRQGADFTPRDRERIAELLNQQNGLTVRYDANRVRASQANYLVVKNARGTVQGCVGVARTTANGMVADLHHLSVDSSVQRQGYGMRLLQAAEARAQELGCQVVQTTVRADNQASRALLQRAGYTRSSAFRNPASGNTLEVWHRPLGAARPADVSPPPAASAPAPQGESWWQEQLARLIRQGHSEEEARRMLVGLLRRMGRPLPAGAA